MSKNYVLIELVELPHEAQDEHDLADAFSKLLTATGVKHDIQVMSAGEIALQFQDDLPFQPTEGDESVEL